MIETLGNLGDFIGGIAVIGSLIYLAIQIRSNTKSNQAQALSQWATFSSFTIDHMIRDREFVELLQRFLSSDDWTQDDPDTIRVSMFWSRCSRTCRRYFTYSKVGQSARNFWKPRYHTSTTYSANPAANIGGIQLGSRPLLPNS